MAQIWCANVGRVKLYLLDTNIPANSPADRVITSNLYGGDSEVRINQEIMLGIGGLKALLAMDIEPTVCHMNEGHAAFMALERIRHLRSSKNMTFEEAVEATKAGNVFTIHTPVKAGNDEFSVELMDRYFGSYFPNLGINRKQFLGAWPFQSRGRTRRLQDAGACTAAFGLSQRRKRTARRGFAAICGHRCGRACRPMKCRSNPSPTAYTQKRGFRAN